jgi:hypothetical protein
MVKIIDSEIEKIVLTPDKKFTKFYSFLIIDSKTIIIKESNNLIWFDIHEY